VRVWNRKLWGVVFTSAGDNGVLIGTAWHGHYDVRYKDEPTRALLFDTRRSARNWCKAEQAKYATRSDTCGTWRFRPVRVQELVRPA
jgi:hypothetical protein